jgi:hypothetical protein
VWRFACHFDFAVDTLDYRYTFLDELGLVTRIFREDWRCDICSWKRKREAMYSLS